MRRFRALVQIALIALLLVSGPGMGAAPIHAAQPAAGPPIRLRAATFTPATGELPAIPLDLRSPVVEPGAPALYLVQFDGPVTPEASARLAALGAEILAYIPEFAFKVRMTPEQAALAAGLAEVGWVGPFHPAYALSPELTNTGLAPALLRLEPGADPAAVAALAATLGIQVGAAQGGELGVLATAAQLAQLVASGMVAWAEPAPGYELHNEFGAGGIVGARAANALGYDGATQIVAVADTGLGGGTAASAHRDLPAGRVAQIFNWPGAAGGCFSAIVDDGAQDPDGHGTHVAGSVLGGGAPDGLGRGAAPAARLVFQAIENFARIAAPCADRYSDGYYLTGLGNLYALFQQAYNAGARIHSNSWGSAVSGAYTIDSATADRFIWDNPDMAITFSAGNSGVDRNADGVVDRDSLGSPATAKNVISVGASENERGDAYPCDTGLAYATCARQNGRNVIFTYGAFLLADGSRRFPAAPLNGDPTAGDAAHIAAFSSRGPTDDGRIKPDVVAPGTWILSTYSDLFQQGYDATPNPLTGAFQDDGYGFPPNQHYKYLSGTSMSNPIVAGGAAVLRDYFQKAHGHNASAALVKATLINTAVDLLDENNDGVDDNAFPIPNLHEGWGRIDLAAATAGRGQFRDITPGLQTNQEQTFSFAASPAHPLKITLVWSDAPSSEAAARNLVNDLDLTVRAPDGTLYSGNVLTGGWSTPGGASDRLNNVENVFVQRPAAGAWTVRVRGFNVPQGPQPFALVVDAGPGALPAAPADLTAATSLDGRVILDWSDRADDESGFVVERCAGAGCSDFGAALSLAANTTSAIDTGRASGRAYRYRLRAVNGAGQSEPSNTVEVRIPAGIAYGLTRSAVAGGGGTSRTGRFVVRGTIGQVDAGGMLVGGPYRLGGGFWGGGAQAPGPEPSAISPARGFDSEATAVTISGTHFLATPRLLLGATQLERVAFADAGSLSAVVPAGLAPGAYDLTVINPGGQAAVLQGAFTVEAAAAPTLATVAPNAGRNDSAVAITLTGSGFVPGSEVRLGARVLTSSYRDATTLGASVPAGLPRGVYRLTVINPGGRAGSLENAFTVQIPPPAITAVTPAVGRNDQVTTLVINGRGFVERPGIVLGPHRLGAVRFNSPEQLEVAVPRGIPPATYELTVTNPDGQSATLARAFRVEGPPAPPPSRAGTIELDVARVTQGLEFDVTADVFYKRIAGKDTLVRAQLFSRGATVPVTGARCRVQLVGEYGPRGFVTRSGPAQLVPVEFGTPRPEVNARRVGFFNGAPVFNCWLPGSVTAANQNSLFRVDVEVDLLGNATQTVGLGMYAFTPGQELRVLVQGMVLPQMHPEYKAWDPALTANLLVAMQDTARLFPTRSGAGGANLSGRTSTAPGVRYMLIPSIYTCPPASPDTREGAIAAGGVCDDAMRNLVYDLRVRYNAVLRAAESDGRRRDRFDQDLVVVSTPWAGGGQAQGRPGRCSAGSALDTDPNGGAPSLIAHELGHCLGQVRAESPHHDGGSHSKTSTVPLSGGRPMINTRLRFDITDPQSLMHPFVANNPVMIMEGWEWNNLLDTLDGLARPALMPGTALDAEAEAPRFHLVGALDASDVVTVTYSARIDDLPLALTPDNPAGAYRLVFLDADGAELGALRFARPAALDEHNDADHAPTGMSLTALLPPGSRRAEIRKGERLLTAIDFTTAAPSLDGVVATRDSNGLVALTWRAEDADSPSLTYNVLLTGDDGLPTLIAHGLRETRFVFDPQVAPEALAATLTVEASDGYNMARATSNPFRIEPRPPVVMITTPTSATVAVAGQSLALQGAGYEASGGPLDDARLTWSSDRDGALGSGASLVVQLSSGAHVLTLTGLAPSGLTATASIRITVLADQDGDGMPDDFEQRYACLDAATADAAADPDSDRLLSFGEWQRGTDPCDADSDDDGAADGDEVRAGTDPRDPRSRPEQSAVALSPTVLELGECTNEAAGALSVTAPQALAWRLTSDASFLSAAPAQGQGDATVKVQVDCAALPGGTYEQIMILTTGGAQRGEALVRFTVPGRDDLWAGSDDLWAQPGAPRAGERAELGLVVRRPSGKATLEQVAVRFYLGDPAAGGVLIGAGSVPLLSPRSASSTNGVAWTPAAAGPATIFAVIDPEGRIPELSTSNNVVSRTIDVLPPGPDTRAPRVDELRVAGGAEATAQREVAVSVAASDPAPGSGVAQIAIVEYMPRGEDGVWAPVQHSGWLPYTTTPHTLTHELTMEGGTRYIQAWARDGAGNISHYPYRVRIAYAPPVDEVGADQTRVYRYTVGRGDRVEITLISASGDADLYVWAPDSAQGRPPWVSNLRDAPDAIAFTAPEAGDYQVEVHGYSAATYRLAVRVIPADDATSELAALHDQQAGGRDAAKALRNAPYIPVHSLPSQAWAPGPAGPAPPESRVYLPLVAR